MVYGADGGMRSLDLTIEIASRSEAGRILCSPRRRAQVSYLVSIGESDERPQQDGFSVHIRLSSYKDGGIHDANIFIRERYC
jgi:hypothetical protein